MQFKRNLLEIRAVVGEGVYDPFHSEHSFKRHFRRSFKVEEFQKTPSLNAYYFK